MHRLGWAALFLVLVAVLAVGGFLAVDRLAGDQEEAVVVQKPELGTAAVIRTDLRRADTFPAVVRNAGARVIVGGVGGTVTNVPDGGAELVRGDRLSEVDGRPVFVFYGDRPMWRTLGSGIEGPEVEQLERNLVALGYPKVRRGEEQAPTAPAPDEVFDDATVRLVEDWRADIGLEEVGSVEVGSVEWGRIVYVNGPVRVDRRLVELGALILPGTPIVEVSEPVQEVRMDLPVDRRDQIAVGQVVVVELPDDVRAAGTVRDIGPVVFSPADGRAGRGFVEVVIHLDDPDLGARFHGYPVDVEMVTAEAIGVLAAPVKALLGLSEGGYALELERNGTVTLVAVETGMYADGLVEVQGDITAGDRVIVPK